jgi:hypothetical protein
LNQGGFVLVVQYPVLACVTGITRVYRYGGKAGTAGERTSVDRRYAIGDSYAGKTGTLFERICADTRYAIGNGYAGKSGAIVERPCVDRRYAIGDGNAAYSTWHSNQGGFVFVIQYAVLTCVNSITRVYRYGGKAPAIIERTAIDRVYAGGDGYTGNVGIVIIIGVHMLERSGADCRYGRVHEGIAYNHRTLVCRAFCEVVGIVG